MAYLDHNAGAPVRPPVAAAMMQALAVAGNPSSVHSAGRAARALVEQARLRLASLLSVAPGSITFTSGGTEANNLILHGLSADTVILSELEHPSLRQVLPLAQMMHVLPSGIIDLSALEQRLSQSQGVVLVSLMAANNETGIVQPVAEAAELCARHGAVLHCDMAQMVGRQKVCLAETGIAFATVSAHKLGGPAGVGALISLNPTLTLQPLLQGGGQERRLRAGTENVAGIVGFGMAAHLIEQDLVNGVPERVRHMRDTMEERALAMVPAAQVVGQCMQRLCNTSCLILPGVPAQLQVMSLDLAGVAVSAGSACSSGKVMESPVLRAMGMGTGYADAAIRVSLGPETRQDEIDLFLSAWVDLARRKGLETA